MIVEKLPWCEPVDVAARLRPIGGLAFLDSAMRHPRLGRYSYVAADPFGFFEVRQGRPLWNGGALDGPPLATLQRLLHGFAHKRDVLLPPFQGGAVGVFSYEFGRCLEPLPAVPAPAWGSGPEACLAFYDVVVAFDHHLGQAWLLSSGLPETSAGQKRDRARRRADLVRSHLACAAPASPPCPAIARANWQSNFSPQQYRAAVAAVVEAILDGELFQANIAQRFMARLPQGFDPWGFYRQLRLDNPAPFAAFLDQGERVIASSSPELFATVEGDRVETRPIKGTARRADDPAADRAAADRLLASAKDRAENMMIVDLLRNDLSRVCRPDSVEVPTLCAMESYAGVHHLVSAVTGLLKPGCTAVDLLAAAFPGGSVTGAPKPQAMRVIARTEREERGAYCGSVACLGFDGTMSSNIAIRTVTIQGGHAAFQVGGGITALSDPEAEYQETFDKAERIFRAFERRDQAEAA
jgi:para-aminobenzoate synthetase component 1